MAIKLAEYNRKRNFGITGEPEGEAAEQEEVLRFAVQHHAARRNHYDLRLEWNGALLSWAVPKGPSYNPRDKRLAVQVEDHPLEYRNFEGTIPKGEYGGGTMMLWDEGFWEPLFDVDEGLRTGSLKFVLKGRRLKGKWALVRMKPKAGETDNNWLFLKEKDDHAQNSDGVSRFVTSIRSGRTMEEIGAGEADRTVKNPFDNAEVQLAKLVTSVPEGEDWLYEIKYDGYRIAAYAEGNGVRLMTRNGNDYTKRFADVAASLADWAAGRAMVLDGEVVILDAEGKSDFQALQNYMRNPKGQKLTYMIFDLLALDGEDLRGRPLIERKETLEALMKDAPQNLRFSQHIQGKGKDFLMAACNASLEGVVGKKPGSLYKGARSGDWIKLKCDKRQEFIICGYTLSDKKTGGVSSILLGAYEGNDLVYAGRAGTGFTARTVKYLEERFKDIKRKESPFKQAPKPRSGETVTWLEPELVAEIKFAEWTGENLLRHASFKGLREDKDHMDVKRETEGIKITNPDRVVFEDPRTTKADIVGYYEKVSERMLPYVENRILSIVRCPKGVAASCFFKKHPGPDNKAIVTTPVTNSKGETEDYFYITDVSGLIYEAQMGTLEFHTWGSRADDLERPDIMVFDLDPDEGMDLETVRQGAKDVKSILEQLSITSFLKTSGGKGYHVVVPFKPAADWDTFHDFARRVAELMEQKWPDRYTSNVRKANRKNKIFIDWIRNGRGATSIAPYSIRARNGARVSMPIAWEELDTVAPDGITMGDALKRIGGSDPWKDFFQIDQRLK
jgi:bifunctional non-homologous end joining protein LigD